MPLRGMTSRVRTASIRAWLAGMALVATVAHAQAPSSGTVTGSPAGVATNDEARRQFAIGVDAMRDERYTDALAAFEASYAIRHAPSVSLNLGITLRALGRFVESRRYLEEFMRQATPTQHTEHDSTVQTFLMDLSRRIGIVAVTEPLPDGAVVTIDGARASLDAERTMPIDPGDHTITATLAGYQRSREQVHVAPGQRAVVALHLVPLVPPHPVAAANNGQRHRSRRVHPQHRARRRHSRATSASIRG